MIVLSKDLNFDESIKVPENYFLSQSSAYVRTQTGAT